MNFNIQEIKKLREETGAGVLEVKQALENADGNYNNARSELMKKVASKAAKKADRSAKDGLVMSYVHHSGKVGSMLILACETDFVAKTQDFQNAAKDIAMQICTEEYAGLEDLMKDNFIKDPSRTVAEVIEGLTAKIGEKIELKKFVKFSVLD